MISEHRQRKLRRYFDANDSNRDGVLEATDIEQNVLSLAVQRGLTTTSQEFKRLRDLYLRVVQVAPGSRMDLDQYFALAEQMTSDTPEGRAYLSEYSDAAFMVIDHKGDGKISFQEYRDYLKAHSCETPQASDDFRRMDGDGDGFITRDEFREHLIEFIAGEDASAPGTNFLGPV